MKDAVFFAVVGCLAVVSIGAGVLGYLHEKNQEKPRASCFKDLYEDNAPKSSDNDDYPY